MKKLFITLALLAMTAGTMVAQDVTNTTTATVEEPDRVEMRAMSKNPSGRDIATGLQVNDTHKCQKAEGQKCDKAEGAHKCQKAEGQKCDKAEAAHKCQKDGNTECHKAGQKCDKPDDQKCDKCKQAEIEAVTEQTPRGPVCRMQPNNGQGKEASIKDAQQAKQEAKAPKTVKLPEN